jgi:hypothetical protein
MPSSSTMIMHFAPIVVINKQTKEKHLITTWVHACMHARVPLCQSNKNKYGFCASRFTYESRAASCANI